jgi:hypothetical protein
MSRFIGDEDLEVFVRDVLQEEPRRKETALRLSDQIKAFKEYEDRAKCSCVLNCCNCYLPIVADPAKIQPGDAIQQVLPDGRIFTLGALGVRTHPDGTFDICTAGWPASIVSTRYPEHGKVELAYKGRGFTKAELRHRREKFGDAWDDKL